MLRQIRVKKEIEIIKSKLAEKEEKIVAIDTREAEIEVAIEEAATEEDLNLVDEEADKLASEREALEAEKVTLTEEIAKLERELEEITMKENSAKKPEKEERGAENMKNELRSYLNTFIKSKGKVRETPPAEVGIEGFTSLDGEAFIPVEALQAENALENALDLARYARVKPVNSGAGKFPLIKKSGAVMHSVEELEANPELAKPNIINVPYEIATFRGYIPVSQEVVDDANYDILSMIAEEIKDQERNTKNAAILTILKAATAKTAEGVDGLKDIKNVTLKPQYNKMAVITASLYNELDKTKDENGRYLLQDNIASPTGKALFGMPVEVVADEDLGLEGALVGFFGDVREFVTVFDRKRVSVKWVDNNIYGQLLASFVRFDAEEVDSEAGVFVTYTPKPDPVV